MTRSTTAAVARPPGAPSVDCLKDLSWISILNKSYQISHHASFWPMGSCTKFMRWWRLLIQFLKVFWSTPCLLPTIDECTDRWSPRTMMPHGHPCAVHGWGLCPNPVAPVVRSSSQAMRERRRAKKKKNHNGYSYGRTFMFVL
jgi:hypothetical protein